MLAALVTVARRHALTQQLDAFLRDFIGYRQDQITQLDIDWDTHNEGFNSGNAAFTLAACPVLVYQVFNGSLRSKPLTEDALQRCRDAMLADIQQLGSASTDPLPRQRRHRRRARASRTR